MRKIKLYFFLSEISGIKSRYGIEKKSSVESDNIGRFGSGENVVNESVCEQTIYFAIQGRSQKKLKNSRHEYVHFLIKLH